MVSVRQPTSQAGLTLLEMLVVLVLIGMLVTLALPRYFTHIDRTREIVLRENLFVLRQNLDRFYGDNARYPMDLQELVTKRYIRAIPLDPITESNATWVVVAPPPPTAGAVADVRSGAPGKASDGRPYKDL